MYISTRTKVLLVLGLILAIYISANPVVLVFGILLAAAGLAAAAVYKFKFHNFRR